MPARHLTTVAWTTHHWVYFLSNLATPLDEKMIADLDKTFRLSETTNAEIMYTWLLLCIASRYRATDAALEKFLLRHGRMKYIRTLYQELIRTDEGRKKAARIYRLARPKYHSAIVRIVDELLAWTLSSCED
jgi:leukotriene-A4 hydrolase